MRIWHQKLIPLLPRQQLLGQHRECCALRGAGWGRKHSVVNYVFKYSPNRLVAYHCLIIDEMKKRGYHPNEIWYDFQWRGDTLKYHEGWTESSKVYEFWESSKNGKIIYPEHNDDYLEECLENLRGKGIEINV